MTRLGAVTFQREISSPLRVTNVFFVPGLNKNIIFVAVLEDHGYDVIFRKGKVFLRHIAMGEVKHMGVKVKELYALKVEDECKALRSKEKVRDLVV